MNRSLALLLIACASLLGCSSDDSGTGMGDDAGLTMDTSMPDAPPKDSTVSDTGTADAGMEATSDAPDDVEMEAESGLPPSGTPCNPPNSIQDQPCGLCGTQYRACLSDGDAGWTWGDWGYCQGEVVNGCDPNKQYPDLDCGNCGKIKQVCLQNCTFDLTQMCQEPMNACTPGDSEFKLGLSCDGGGRSRDCDQQCQWTNWGNCTAGITPIFGRLALGYYHSCAVNNNGVVKCMGYNAYGQLGNNSTSSSNVPVTANLSNVTSMGAGYAHTCATVQSGSAYCWGYNTFGQIGDNTTTSRSVPTVVSNLSNALAIEAGYYSSCAVQNSGSVQCWGYNTYGQLGNNSTTTAYVPVTASGISTGMEIEGGIYMHSCARLANGTAQCWGYNVYGQIGDNSTTTRTVPTNVSNLSTITSMTEGSYHTCAVLQSGDLYCWGYNVYGQLGNGNTTNSSLPIKAGISAVVAVAGGYYHTCALTLAGEVDCVGYNGYGQLGNGTTTSSTTFVKAISSGARAIACGAYHTCALMSSGALKCWGNNGDGELGDGTNVQRTSPTLVTGF